MSWSGRPPLEDLHVAPPVGAGIAQTAPGPEVAGEFGRPADARMILAGRRFEPSRASRHNPCRRYLQTGVPSMPVQPNKEIHGKPDPNSHRTGFRCADLRLRVNCCTSGRTHRCSCARFRRCRAPGRRIGDPTGGSRSGAVERPGAKTPQSQESLRPSSAPTARSDTGPAGGRARRFSQVRTSAAPSPKGGYKAGGRRSPGAPGLCTRRRTFAQIMHNPADGSSLGDGAKVGKHDQALYRQRLGRRRGFPARGLRQERA